ncbi:acyltransferase [Flavobacterium rivuli WB 3.3-2 = DSM 21788]|uniref:Acyltransferase n=1 Tax=Flavobacterium rivuli WB 3.3-2 = DSM 21788 TaxID=1121895 RepID=A0A0A2M702_9FLAO|nr:acyltransferase [Flavobacterium rivuli]KGO88064.1 acyltransferase [Flavobacterium rivuli WB 3.3-2 = DSM 21788]
MNVATPAVKPHYVILDGLRGLAAIIVVLFHIFGVYPDSYQIFHHGYLAVDFFFMLSGFVIGYAYDDRWGTLKTGNFFIRRLVRLQPMVVVGSLLGALFFYSGECSLFPLIAGTPVWKMLLIMVVGCTLLPIRPSMDIRGWSEMYPLNGSAWSLLFEYVANVLYALFIRKFSKTTLFILAFVSAAALVHHGVTAVNGTISGGASLTLSQVRIGLIRLLYPFLAGLLLYRVVRIRQIKYAFLWSGILLIAALAFPAIGNENHLWMNGLYDALTIIIVFPLIVYLGAAGTLQNKTGLKVCKFFADISYPVYIIHFPFIYAYMAFVVNNKPSFSASLPVAALLFICSIVIAYACLKLYDEPVRKWLNKKFN